MMRGTGRIAGPRAKRPRFSHCNRSNVGGESKLPFLTLETDPFTGGRPSLQAATNP